jgi:hypothetical protein
VEVPDTLPRYKTFTIKTTKTYGIQRRKKLVEKPSKGENFN